MLDWIIRNATVVDGVQGEFQADVAIEGDKIAAVLPVGASVEAAHTLDASGLVLTPGTIDIHRHADLMPVLDQPWSELPQGLTTMISGNCGFSPVPNAPDTFEAVREYALPILGRIPDWVCGKTTGQFYDEMEKRPLKINCGYLVGNGDLRRSVTGFSDAPLTAVQLDAICGKLDEALCDGAMGLSMGIMYTPECYYNTDELSRVAAVAAKHGRPVTSHIRGEGRSVVASVDEMIEIGKRSGAHIHISHMKAAGTDMWGHAVNVMLDHIDRARREGLEISFDAYPYTAGSTTLLSLFPPETLAQGTEGVLKQIADPKGRAYILSQFAVQREGWDNFIQTLGWGRVIVSGSSNKEEVGKTIQELADQTGCDPGEYALDLLAREKGCVPTVLEEMAPDDVRKILTRPDCIVISDSLYSAAGMPHPRKYGAFQRFLCQYVKEEKALTRQQAIAKMTCMPARLFGLEKRGRVLEGYYADLTLMDWDKLRDRATYTDPIQDSEGVTHVFVNGQLAFADKQATSCAAGRLLRCRA